MNRIINILTCTCLLLFASCSEKNGETAADLIVEISSMADETNVLRVDIKVTLKQTGSIAVEYWKQGDESTKRTITSKEPAIEPAVKLLFLEPEAKYDFRVKAESNRQTVTSDVYNFTVKNIPAWMPEYTNLLESKNYSFDGYIFVANQNTPGYLYLLDDNGKIVWYQSTFDKSVFSANFDPLTATFQCQLGMNVEEAFCNEEVMVIDLYGNVIMRKKATELSNPLIHHYITRLPDGNIAVTAFYDGIFDLTGRGGGANERVRGDGFSIIDMNGETVWEWNAFEQISPADDPNIMSNRFIAQEREGIFFMLNNREDWLHANSIESDIDGNFLISINKMSQVWKIDSKTGEIIYRLGKDGDIDVPAEGYASNQHAVHVNPDGEIMLFDNGFATKQSRVLSFKVDEANKKATVSKNILLPKEYYSPTQSSAFMVDNSHVLVGASGPDILGIFDLAGNPIWAYEASHPFFIAVYVKEINL